MKKTEEMKKFREMSLEHLGKELETLERELMNSNLKVAAGKLGNFSTIEKQKKNIARIKTIINEKSEE
jgi:ribosomal protein L29